MAKVKTPVTSRSAIKTAFWISLVYIVFGAGWILFSDLALESTITDSVKLTRYQTYKGWFYVGITATLLFFLIYRAQMHVQGLYRRDPVTNLSRHYQFAAYLGQMLAQAKEQGKCVQLMYLDIDNFKAINSKLGFEGADGFLRTFAERLKASYLAEVLTARLGTDQFAVAVMSNQSTLQQERETQHLRECFHDAAARQNLDVTCCIGVAIAPNDASSGPELINAAQSALKAARQTGKGKVHLFNRALSKEENDRQALLEDLRATIASRSLSLVYQPQFDIAGARLTGVEVLVRWHHPRRGMVPPDKFIPLAEADNLISYISEFVVRRAAQELSEAGLLGTLIQRVSVNVSAKEFNTPQLMQLLTDSLRNAHQLAPYLQLEITETAALSNLPSSVVRMTKLKEHGIRFSIDDFGTGFTSLAMLKNLPIDEVKIDRLFVKDMQEHPKSQSIVAAISRMASDFGISVVAEGVETQSQLEQLALCGCQEVQGYLLAKPMAVQDLKVFVQALPQQPPQESAYSSYLG
ncbi:bifunctional diguanylate cyclase/phosphodiesterase [Aliiglaciecola sp. CAU 1673]|uniref:putative bifunctional diguanylate cyclase/phosphodiesterase n=1 Tax=Aliiglaciecola sp. CAU 1673 TaxID=3032595 RepID=UPI0023DA95B2|nr:bifunctional diguanylate cyclase/phosphodiesterase [Aliiglaciecola sp. CAU 1673]MDF2176833.1 bifunctional diguanylate cyclase/phosphodiesterase [Aliiglaciecola sp. CAU 1673]